MHIALDAMGGDHGPEELIAGAIQAVQEENLQVSLVGDERVIRKSLEDLSPDPALLARLPVVHTSEMIEMGESPVEAIRKKKNASVMVAFDLVKNNKADGAVSAGNSGATMAAAVRKLGRIKSVSRPGIASAFPTLKQPVVMMDVGANVDCRPQHLLQFAIMASAFSQIFKIKKPRVGLLSIGEESGKGNLLVKETHAMLRESSLNFVGNVEGRDIWQGNVDVIVCDGFIGNVCLKVSEGLVEAAGQMIREGIMSSLSAKIGYWFARPVFRRLKKRVDYAEYGGAPLLGINGTGIVCHGKSSSAAIKNALLEATKIVEMKVNVKIESTIAANLNITLENN